MPKISLLLTILCLWVAASRLQAQTCANRALSFDGADDFVTAVGAPVNGTTDFTLEARFFCTSTSTNTRRLLTLGNNSPSNRFELCERGGFLTFVRQAVNGSTSLTQVSTVNLRDNAWHHLAVTRQGATINFYLDGVAQTPVTLTGTLNYNLFYFGRALSPYATNSNWQGSIDEVKIWNIARSLSDITAGAGSPQVCPTANLVAFYSFDQGVGGEANPNETILQECLNLNDGTLSNFALTGATSNWVCGDANFAGAAGGCPAQFTYTISGCDSVSFQNTTPQAPAYTFNWAFGDGSTSTIPSPGHVYTQPGAYQVCLTATSAAGTACTTCQSVTLSDMVPPTAICNLPLTITLPPGAPIVMITPGMINNGSSDNCQLSSLSVNPNQMNCQQACGGPQTVTLIATDWAGNTSTCTTTVNVIDNTPPSVSCPANMQVQGIETPTSNGVQCLGAFSSISATIFDNCTINNSVTYSVNGPNGFQVSGNGANFGLSALQVGSYTGTFTAVDNCGNYSVCSYNLIVTECASTPNPETLCMDFNDQSLHNWGGFGIENHMIVSPGASGLTGDYAMSAKDDSGASFVVNAQDFDGNWALFNDSCFCFDIKVHNDGNQQVNFPIYPALYIYNHPNTNTTTPGSGYTQAALFLSNFYITESTGWIRICAPLDGCSGGALPNNGNGTWTLLGSATSCGDWNNLLQNVTHVGLKIDYHPNPAEVIHWDNFCFEPCSAPLPQIDCDDFAVTASSIPNGNGACCSSIDIVNNTGETDLTSLELNCAGANFTNIVLPAGYTYLQPQGYSITVFPPVGSYIPSGLINDLVQFCLDWNASPWNGNQPNFPVKITVKLNKQMPGTNASYRVCTDSVFVCGQINPCDEISSVTAQAHTTEPSCCFSLLTDNNLPDYFKLVGIKTLPGVSFHNIPMPGAGWSLQAWNFSDEAIFGRTGGGYIPTGTNQVANFCLEDYVSDQQSVLITYYDDNYQIVCSDTLTTNCNACVDIYQDSTYCEGWGNYGYTFCIEAGWNIDWNIDSLVLIPPPGFEFENTNFSVISLAPGDKICSFSTGFSFDSSYQPGDTVCFTLVAHNESGICCSELHCLVIPECDPCLFTSADCATDSACCFTITLNNPDDLFSSVFTNVLTPGWGIGSWGIPFPSWYVTTIGAFPFTSVNWSATSAQNYHVQNGEMLPDICLQPIGGGTPSGPVLVEIVWTDTLGLTCRDTCIFDCSPTSEIGQDCAIVDSVALTCQNTGEYAFTFEIRNDMLTGVDAGYLHIDASGSNVIAPSDIYVNIPYGATVSQTVAIYGNPGEIVCLTFSLHEINDDSLHLNCCENKEELCVTLPQCALSCENNLLSDGGFENDYNAGGYYDTALPWQSFNGSPQYSFADTCATAGGAFMWGNQIVGEGVFQNVGLTAGNLYQIEFCAHWIDQVVDHGQVRVMVDDGTATYAGCVSPNCLVVGITPMLSTSWSTYTFNLPIHSGGYSRLIFTPWNNHAVNNGNYVSWIALDDVCVEDVGEVLIEEEEKEEITIRPNPANAEIEIFLMREIVEFGVIRIFDAYGKMVKTAPIQARSNGLRFDISTLPEGMYFVEIIENGKRISIERFVKQ